MQIVENSCDRYFKRQIELWGLEVQKSLLHKSVLIVGSGGLGCSLGIALGGSGVGRIDLLDFDEVSYHNLHRQIAFELDDLGKKKCEVLKQTIVSRNPYVEVNSYDIDLQSFIKEYDSMKKRVKYDLIIDATDNLPTRAMIDSFAKSVKTLWLYGSVEEFHGYVCLFENISFESIFQINNRTPKGITAPIVMQIASIQANIALRYLANYKVAKDKLYYCYYDQDGDFCLQKFGL